MPVPKYDEMMVPVLRRIAETPGDTVTSKQLRRFVIDYWGLSDNEVAETISSGFERYANNMLWACTYLKQQNASNRQRGGPTWSPSEGSTWSTAVSKSSTVKRSCSFLSSATS